VKCQTCCRELGEPMYRRSPPAPRAPARPRSVSHHDRPSPPDVGGAHGHLRQVVADLSVSFDMTIAVHGPGSPDECFAQVARVAPAFTRSMAVEHGLGYINGDLTFPWSMVAGPAGSALLFFGHPDADSEWSFDHVLLPLLRELRSPWEASVRAMDDLWTPEAAAVIDRAREALPLWKLEALAHTRPRGTTAA
jgi:hypothetical protein